MRARVFSEAIGPWRYWVYEIRNPNNPEGHQVLACGVRPSWREAMDAAEAGFR